MGKVQKKTKLVSLRQKLLTRLLVLLLLVCIALGAISYTKASSLAYSIEQDTLIQRADNVAVIINQKLQSYEEQMTILASSDILHNKDVSVKEKVEYLKDKLEDTKFSDFSYVDLEGNYYGTTGMERNIAGSEDFELAKQGQMNISDPRQLETGRIITVAAPIKDDSGNVTGVLMAVQKVEAFATVIEELGFNFFIITKTGDLVAHVDPEVLEQNVNALEAESPDSDIYKIYEGMVAGETGFASFVNEFKEETNLIGYAPIECTNWSVALMINDSELIKPLDSLKYSIAFISGLGLLLGGAGIMFVALRVANSILMITEQLKVFAVGDFSTVIEQNNVYKIREIQEAQESMDQMRQQLGKMIESVQGSVVEINSDMEELTELAKNVEEGSSNIALSSNQMSEGIESQSSDMVEISETFDEFGVRIEQVIQAVHQVADKTESTGRLVQEGNEKAERLNKSVDEVGKVNTELNDKMVSLSTHITQVTEITNLINEVASQTNLLALNASIEAARAGEAGKGFAVVAEEIRKLAEEVRVSSDKIDKLIESIREEASAMSVSTNSMSGELTSQMEEIRQMLHQYNEIAANLSAVRAEVKTVSDTTVKIGSQKNVIITQIASVTAVSEEITASTEEITASTETNSNNVQNVFVMANQLAEITKAVAEEIGKFKI